MRRCMALLAASARALLRDLLRWQAFRHADVARQCAEHLSHLYEDIAERKVTCKFYHSFRWLLWNPGILEAAAPTLSLCSIC